MRKANYWCKKFLRPNA